MSTTTMPDVDESPFHFLEQVNEELIAVIAMATSDFKTVKVMLKTYFDNASTRQQQQDPAIRRQIDAMIIDLQYMDIFCQRVEHLVWAHQQIISDRSALTIKESIFHLHVFQSMTIEMDLLRAVASIHDTLMALKEHFIQAGGVTWAQGTFFNNTAQIKDVLSRTVSVLAGAAGDIRHLPVPPFSERQQQMLNSLYTMESERLVLAWFIDTIPVSRWEDLYTHYETTFRQLDTGDNTEIF